MSSDTATLTMSGWLSHDERATTAWAAREAMRIDAIPIAIATSSPTLT